MTDNKTADALKPYAAFFKAWRAGDLGSKPTAEMLYSIHGLGARPGKQALANAMALRPEGVTGAQIVMACGAPQLNKMRGFITDGLLKREATAADAKGHTVYKLAVTAKGTKRIESFDRKAAELAARGEADTAAKPKAKKASGKAKGASKRKAAPKAETPTSDAPNAPQVPVTVDAPQGDQPQVTA